MNGNYLPSKGDLTAFQRGVLLGWALAHGEGMTARDVAEMTGIGLWRARQMLCDAACVIPIQRANNGVWETAAMGEAD